MKPKYFLFLPLFFLLLSFSFSEATLRYVSKTGTSTPPYTSWQTAATSIQLCIDYSSNTDTIYVANGVYQESLIINKYLWLIGSSMDSTVIDGTGLADITIDGLSNFILTGFNIIGKERNELSTTTIAFSGFNPTISNCRISKAGSGIYMGRSSGKVENVIINNCNLGIDTFCAQDTCYPEISECLIFMNNTSSPAISIFDGGNPLITKNIIIGGEDCNYGINVGYSVKTIIIKNNIVSGFILKNISPSDVTDSALIENNISAYLPENNFGWAGIEGDPNTVIRNNITAYSNVGIRGWSTPVTNNNLFWQNINNTIGGASVDSSDIVADPMFVNDTIPIYGGSYDFHLQKYSPAIDTGDPTILDKDGSRSDIGIFGGPLGQKYTYKDLAPKPPRNLTAAMDSGLVHLKWNKNTEADLFRYRVYRDTVPNFIYDTTKIIAVISDTSYYDDVPEKYKAKNYYYKITAIDSSYHQSTASEEVHINITGIPEAPPMVIDHYNLLQNYPNPFNPSTTIPYRLKAPGYVKVMVYNILGELVRVLVNKYQSAGYYEVLFNPDEMERKRGEEGFPGTYTWYHSNYVSGVYLYRIEVIGEGNIPVFMDMKEMMLVK